MFASLRLCGYSAPLSVIRRMSHTIVSMKCRLSCYVCDEYKKQTLIFGCHLQISYSIQFRKGIEVIIPVRRMLTRLHANWHSCGMQSNSLSNDHGAAHVFQLFLSIANHCCYVADCQCGLFIRVQLTTSEHLLSNNLKSYRRQAITKANVDKDNRRSPYGDFRPYRYVSPIRKVYFIPYEFDTT